MSVIVEEYLKRVKYELGNTIWSKIKPTLKLEAVPLVYVKSSQIRPSEVDVSAITLWYITIGPSNDFTMSKCNPVCDWLRSPLLGLVKCHGVR